MRNAFAREIEAHAESDSRIVLLSGDIGNRMFDSYKAKFPDRFYNCGISEQNMIGMAAGLAMAGFRPVCYTITPFITYRCLEQIRVDLCYHDLPVMVVGVGGGLSYASLGATHHACEDIAMLRSLPNMRVACPGDAYEVSAICRSLFDAGMEAGPAYLRLGKKNEPLLHQTVDTKPVGASYLLKRGGEEDASATRVAFLSCGNILPEVMDAAERCRTANLSISVYSMPWVKPLNELLLERLCLTHDLIVTVEEHSRIGGFGSCISEYMSSLRQKLVIAGQREKIAHHLIIGTEDLFLHTTGNQAYARTEHGIDSDAIYQKVKMTLSGLKDESETKGQSLRLVHPNNPNMSSPNKSNQIMAS